MALNDVLLDNYDRDKYKLPRINTSQPRVSVSTFTNNRGTQPRVNSAFDNVRRIQRQSPQPQVRSQADTINLANQRIDQYLSTNEYGQKGLDITYRLEEDADLFDPTKNPYIRDSIKYNPDRGGQLYGKSISLGEAFNPQAHWEGRNDPQALSKRRMDNLIKDLNNLSYANNVPILGWLNKAGGSADELENKQMQLAALMAGYDVDLERVGQMNNALHAKSLGLLAPLRLFTGGEGELDDELARVGSQFADSVSFGYYGARNPYFNEIATPQTFAGKIGGGGMNALGFLANMAALGPLTSKAGTGVQGLAKANLGNSKAAQFLIRQAPSLTNAGVAGFLRTPNAVDPTTRNVEGGLGSFLNPMARAGNAASSIGTVAIGNTVGGVVGAPLRNVNPWLRRGIQGLAGGSADTGVAYLRGVRDPGDLASEFVTGGVFAARAGDQDVSDFTGRNADGSPVVIPGEIVRDRGGSDKLAQDANFNNRFKDAMQGSKVPANAEIERIQRDINAGKIDPVRAAEELVKVQNSVAPTDPYYSAIKRQVDSTLGNITQGKLGQPSIRNNVEFEGIMPGQRIDIDKFNLSEKMVEDYNRYISEYDDIYKATAISALENQRPRLTGFDDNESVIYRAGDANGRFFTRDESLAKQYGDAKAYRLDGKVLDLASDEGASYIRTNFGEDTLQTLRGKGKLPDGGDPEVVKLLEQLSPQIESDYSGVRVAETFEGDGAPESIFSTRPGQFAEVDPFIDSLRLSGDVEQNRIFNRVKRAIENGSRPRGEEAQKLYDEVTKGAEQEALNSMTSDPAYMKFNARLNQNVYEGATRAGVEGNAEIYKDIARVDSEVRPSKAGVYDNENLTVNRDLTMDDLNSKVTEFRSQNQNRALALELLGESNQAAVRRYLGADGIAKARLNEGLAPALKGNVNPEDLRQFDKYMAASRNQDFAKEGKKGATKIAYEKDNLKKAATGKVDYELEEVGADPSKYYKPGFEKAKEAIRVYNNKLLDDAAEAGVLTRASVDAMKENDNYIPFYRLLDEEVGNNNSYYQGSAQVGNVSKQNVIFGYEGSDKPILSPTENLIRQTAAFEQLIARNNVAATTIRSLQENPNLADLVQKVDKTTGLDQDQYLSVLVDGEKQVYKVPEPIGKAAKNLPYKSVSDLGKILSIPSRILGKGATSANIDFLLGTNLVRDQFSAAINSRYGFRPVIDWAKGVQSFTTRDATYQDFLSSGAEISFGGMKEADLLKEYTRPADPNKVSTFTRKVGDYAKNPFLALRDLGEFSDTSTRVGLYRRAIEQGATPEQAMIEARGATSDFSVRGSGGLQRELFSMIPFMNARIQGFDSTVSAARRDPKKFAINTAIYAVLPTLLTEAALSQTLPGQTDQITEYDRDKYFIIPIKGSASVNPEDFVKIPKSDVAQWINPIRRSYNMQQRGEEVNPAAFVGDLIGEVSPVGGIDGDLETGQVKVNPGEFIPQAIKPIMEVTTNYDFFRERPIDSEFTQDLPAGYRTDYKTDPLFADLGARGALGPLSPNQAQQLTYGYTAGLGKQVSDLIGKFIGSESRYPVERRPGDPNTRGIPVVNRFLGVNLRTPDEQAQNRYYDVRDLQDQYNAIRRSDAIPYDVKQRELTRIRQEIADIQTQGDIRRLPQ